MKPNIQLDNPLENFIAQLRRVSLSMPELEEIRKELLLRIEAINRQLDKEASLETTWAKGAMTAKKYFYRKVEYVESLMNPPSPSEALPASIGKKSCGFLATFEHGADTFVVACRQNISELWAEMITAAAKKSEPIPALLAYVSLTEPAARMLPQDLWYDRDREELL